MRLLRAVVCVLALTAGLGWIVLARQQDPPATGMIEGTVTDVSNAPISSANVVVTGGDETRSSATDDKGHYVVPDLPPGVYDVSIVVDGFGPFERDNVAIAGGADTEIDVKLEPKDSPGSSGK